MTKSNLTGTITINREDLLFPLAKTLTECSNAVFIGLASLEDLKEIPNHIDGEEELRKHKPHGFDISFEERKKMYRDWLVKKGVEDIIKAVNNMLVEVCGIFDTNDKLKSPMPFEEAKKIIYTTDNIRSKTPLPGLLNLIKDYLTAPLIYENEISSINAVRNCLVHRDGIVRKEDIKGDEQVLELKWIYHRFYNIDNGKSAELEMFSLIRLNSKIEIKEEKKVIKFKLNDKIEITYQLFNDLIITCSKFGEDLINKLTFEKKVIKNE